MGGVQLAPGLLVDEGNGHREGVENLLKMPLDRSDRGDDDD
jgi:hypothetical protein